MTGQGGIERLFVALPLPRPVAELLARLQPPAGPDIRPTAREDMHVTLHFLGNARVSAVQESLEPVRAAAFPIRLSAPGHFTLPAGRKILWIGVEPMALLLDLHRLVGATLAPFGFVEDSRRYIPHVTLARLTESAPLDAIRTFEEQDLPHEAQEFDCVEFALYASRTSPEGASYRILERYPLQR